MCILHIYVRMSVAGNDLCGGNGVYIWIDQFLLTGVLHSAAIQGITGVCIWRGIPRVWPSNYSNLYIVFTIVILWGYLYASMEYCSYIQQQSFKIFIQIFKYLFKYSNIYSNIQIFIQRFILQVFKYLFKYLIYSNIQIFIQRFIQIIHLFLSAYNVHMYVQPGHGVLLYCTNILTCPVIESNTFFLIRSQSRCIMVY